MHVVTYQKTQDDNIAEEVQCTTILELLKGAPIAHSNPQELGLGPEPQQFSSRTYSEPYSLKKVKSLRKAFKGVEKSSSRRPRILLLWYIAGSLASKAIPQTRRSISRNVTREQTSHWSRGSLGKQLTLDNCFGKVLHDTELPETRNFGNWEPCRETATPIRETAKPGNTMSGNDHSDTPTHLSILSPGRRGVGARARCKSATLSCHPAFPRLLARTLGRVSSGYTTGLVAFAPFEGLRLGVRVWVTPFRAKACWWVCNHVRTWRNPSSHLKSCLPPTSQAETPHPALTPQCRCRAWPWHPPQLTL